MQSHKNNKKLDNDPRHLTQEKRTTLKVGDEFMCSGGVKYTDALVVKYPVEINEGETKTGLFLLKHIHKSSVSQIFRKCKPSHN